MENISDKIKKYIEKHVKIKDYRGNYIDKMIGIKIILS